MADPRPNPTPSDPTESGLPHEPHSLGVIGQYRIVRLLGAGGMGLVYEAEQQHPKRVVAVKVIRGGTFVDDHRVRLFQREAQALARLKHPAIAAIYESGRTEDGQHFFAMEIVRGQTLGARLARDSTLPLARAELRLRLALFGAICEAVHYAHQHGVIHRDLKPGNILVVGAPGPETSPFRAPPIKILDFGLARITEADLDVATLVTDAGRVEGSLPYMSPEQVRGNTDEIDLRSDVYSLGVILYEMIAGRVPIRVGGLPLYEATRAICEAPPPRLRGLVKSWKPDEDLETIVLKALEKEPARRYQSVAALGDDVARYVANQPILARAPSASYQIRKLVSRHHTAFGAGVALIVMVVAFAVAMALQARRVAQAAERATREAESARKVSQFLVDLFQVSDP